MRFSQWLRSVVSRKAERLNPVFIIGCGRSGTTILGESLGQHRRITYLNEPRDLWAKAYPETDIWSDQAMLQGSKLELTAADEEPWKSKKLRALFSAEATRRRRPIVVEKLPINNFRLPFIKAVFPNARFVHIYRNGLEVARSIAQLNESGKWFRRQKWEQLVRIAVRDDATAPLPSRCLTSFDKGLLEWRLSTEAAVAFLEGLPTDRYLELSYRSLVEDPVAVMARIVRFIGVEEDESVYAFVRENVSRRTAALGDIDPTSNQELIGGPLVRVSMVAKDGLTSVAAVEGGMRSFSRRSSPSD